MQFPLREVVGRSYFGSKKRLFQKAIEGEFDARPLLAGLRRDAIAERLAQILLNPTKDRSRFDATLLMLRSAEVRKVLSSALDGEFLAPLGEALGGKASRARAVAALAVLAGFDLLHTVLGIEVLNQPEGRRLLVKLSTRASTTDAAASGAAAVAA